MKLGLACLCMTALCAAPGSAQRRTPSPRPAPAEARSPSAVHLQFVNTDVSDVLQAISMKTHANIVYPSSIKRPVSLNINAATVGEAIGYASSAAGLTWKQVGSTFIVAPAADLKQMLESFGQSAVAERNEMPSAEALLLLAGALPYLTVRPAGQQLLLIGTSDDIAQARLLLARQERPAAAMPVVSEVISLHRLIVKEAASMVQSLYPGLKAEPVGAGDKAGGGMGLYGVSTLVAAAKATLLKLDDGPSNAPEAPVRRIYAIRYSSAGVLRTFLEQAMPGVSAVAGPEQYAPPQPSFHPLSGAISGSVGGGSGGGASGGGAGGGAGGASSGAGGGDASAGAKSSTAPDRARLLVISGAKLEVDNAIRLLEDVDIAPRQVVIEVKVVDISPEKAQDLGVRWDWSPINFIEYAPHALLLNGSASPQTQFTLPGHGGTFSRVPFSFQAILSAMISRKDAKILADPSIQVLDNDDANIFIGDTLRTQVSQSGIAGTTVQVFEFPVGIILLVRPRVNVDGLITMRVHPVVSTITGIGAGNLPQTSTREAETTVRVKDGETVVIGGLIRDEMSKVVQEIPFLSKLPLVGELFRNTSTNHRHSEIMVFITPRIVK